ncbi:MAG: chromosome partitioning protein ParB [Gemmatimonadota bacterium]|nr:MAG: chromosome partitioning protein ParB [Gemmatimonadota bacterium]
MSQRGLGRGLGALIPATSALRPQDGELVLNLAVSSIHPNPRQPRREFDDDDLATLSESIREQGLLQPVIVRTAGADSYELIAGERRWRAATQAGFERIPALLRETHDEQMLPLALIENLVREDLNPIEEALAYESLVEDHGWTQEDVSERVGRSRTHVANTVRLLRLPAEIQSNLASGQLTAGHARALLACDSEEEVFRLRDAILEQSLSVREAEDRSRKAAPEGTTRRTRRKTTVRNVSPEARDLEERLQRVLGTPVQIHDKKGRGRISMEFYSYDDLSRLTDLLFSCNDQAPLR